MSAHWRPPRVVTFTKRQSNRPIRDIIDIHSYERQIAWNGLRVFHVSRAVLHLADVLLCQNHEVLQDQQYDYNCKENGICRNETDTNED